MLVRQSRPKESAESWAHIRSKTSLRKASTDTTYTSGAALARRCSLVLTGRLHARITPHSVRVNADALNQRALRLRSKSGNPTTAAVPTAHRSTAQPRSSVVESTLG